MSETLFIVLVAIVIIQAATWRRIGLVNWLDAWKNIGKAFVRLLGDGKELVLFALFEVAAIAATALIFLVFGIPAGFYVLIGAVGLFAILVMKPPAQKR